ncbi:WxcM-like domain-containing protein [Fulvimonas soli]|jgi:serine acetyltransferase|uniref:Transferase family hexapeptide repeat protein n=1 Tax=Fulvimonas soli TaxID=155197 RepID=A0A316HT47_9GAMM|nr:WxcM-like domain-containing protein [Fulvimonas soli]PWK83089.1 transferase family hexapeptide repeat protein [Fulvimonas soli]TNY26132.1 hypothetical protein BV497_10335 [Fulvimonas soli]
MISRDAIVSPQAAIGRECAISPGAIVGDRVTLGDHVRIGAGAIVLGPCHIGDHCTLGAGVVLESSDGDRPIVLEPHVRVSATASILAPVTVARGALIQAGTTILRPVPAHAIVSGNPAQITGYTLVHASEPPAASGARPAPEAGAFASHVDGVTLHRLPKVIDLRGNLTVGEFERDLPFRPKRYFMVFGVPNAEVRGEHAHHRCKQFLICARGRCSIVADDGANREEFLLDDPSLGLYLPPRVWGIQYKYSADAVLLVFASEYYDPDDYIRDYGEFMRLAGASRSTAA